MRCLLGEGYIWGNKSQISVSLTVVLETCHVMTCGLDLLAHLFWLTKVDGDCQCFGR